MTVDQKVVPEHEQAEQPVSTATVVGYAVVGVVLVGWFLFGLAGVQQGFVDSVGEVGRHRRSRCCCSWRSIGSVRRNRR